MADRAPIHFRLANHYKLQGLDRAVAVALSRLAKNAVWANDDDEQRAVEIMNQLEDSD